MRLISAPFCIALAPGRQCHPLAQVRIFWSRAWFRAFLSIFFTMAFLTDTTLGIDFGTSNSAVAVRQGNSPARMLRLEGENNTLPTALFFNAEDHRTHYGRDAVAQYLSGTEGRLMRSLKSLLGSSLLQDKTAVHNALVSYQDIISLFLRMLAQTARETLGGMPGRVLLGRPVHFVDGDTVRDQQAEDALRQAARDAGFVNISFQLEPIAAALDYEQRIERESLVLVVDIGGGTSTAGPAPTAPATFWPPLACMSGAPILTGALVWRCSCHCWAWGTPGLLAARCPAAYFLTLRPGT